MNNKGYSKRSFVDTEQVSAKRLCVRDQYCLPETVGVAGQTIVQTAVPGVTEWEDISGATLTMQNTYDNSTEP